jgi:aminotransferase in exopolysaccharide biosynthesis
MIDFENVVRFIHELYGSEEYIPLHVPVFVGNEKKYLAECIDSTYVSSVGAFVDRFEDMIAKYTNARQAVVAVNGTNALQVALRLVGVEGGSEVITQPLTFVATCNAIKYQNAEPVFVDVDKDSMGLSPASLRIFLDECGTKRDDGTYNKQTGRKISACLPMHTFGHPVRIQEIVDICDEWGIPVVEDAAESLGSYIEGKHTGVFGKLGVISFNGNKTITTGGGGVIITDDEELAKHAKYLTTTAKKSHAWEFYHDELGYNYRMPNINAALGCAQMEQLEDILKNKRETADAYNTFFAKQKGIWFVKEREGTKANYWLNAVVFDNLESRNHFLKYTNDNGVMTRPVWTLMYRLPMYKECFRIDTPNAEWLEERVVNMPSSVKL